MKIFSITEILNLLYTIKLKIANSLLIRVPLQILKFDFNMADREDIQEMLQQRENEVEDNARDVQESPELRNQQLQMQLHQQQQQQQQEQVDEPMDEDISDMDDDDDISDDFSLLYGEVHYEYYDDDETPNSIRYIANLNEFQGIDMIHNLAKHPKNVLCDYTKIRSPSQRPMYKFRPLQLEKCKYKNYCSHYYFPSARSGHRVIASESHLYSLGGYNPHLSQLTENANTCQLFQELWAYNFATRQWKRTLDSDKAPHMPRELASNALAMHGNVLISHGGTSYPFGEQCSNDCYVYTTGEKPAVLRLDVSGDLPTAQYGPGIVLHDHYLYTIGGTTGFDYSCDVYRLNLKTKIWENMYLSRPEMRDDPEGRYRHEVVYDGHFIYILGGGTSTSVYDLKRIPAFNLKTNSWNYFDTLPDRTLMPSTSAQAQLEQEQQQELQTIGYPKPRKCFTCVQYKMSNGDVTAFITGGLQGDITTSISDIWKLNMRTKQWTCIRTSSLPKPLYFHSAAHSNNGCMYIFGGIEYDNKDTRRRNDLHKMWMDIPKLSEICWDAYTYYNDVGTQSRNSLLKVGVPKRFVERVHSPS